MVRASKKNDNGEKSTNQPPNPEAEERKRLKKLAFTQNLLTQTPAKSSTHLNPSKIVIKHHGTDILKKSQRKNRFLFSFPGLIAPINGGKIGELKNLGTKNPILYLDFPQGQVKLFGTIVYPKNRYLTLQFSKGGKSVICEDNFDNMIVFSEAWWIGRKDENPEELRLEFPKELVEEKHANCDFKGGAGASAIGEEKSVVNKPRGQKTEPLSSSVTPDDDISEDSCPSIEKNVVNLTELTPVRQSARTAGRKFNFADSSSGNDSDGSDERCSEVPITKEKGICEKTEEATPNACPEKTEGSGLVVDATYSVNSAAKKDLSGKDQNSLSLNKSKEISSSKRGPLVQATIATLFQKVVVKKSAESVKKSSTTKASGQKLSNIGLKRKLDLAEDEGPSTKRTATKKKAEKRTVTKQKQSQVTDDSIEDISSESSEGIGDEDWDA